MASSSGQNFVGDYLRAVDALELGRDDTDLRGTIAALLGLEIRDAGPNVIPPEPVSGSIPEPPGRVDPGSGQRQLQEISEIAFLEPHTTGETKPGSSGLQWLDAVKPLPQDTRARVSRSVQPWPYPLLQLHWIRGIVVAALATRSRIGELDLDELVAELSEARPISRLPLLAARTLGRGVQVLIDQGDGMLPFRQDQQWLVQQLRLIVGSSRLEVLKFEACPSRGTGAGWVGEWGDYKPPPSGRPVLVLTDLGISRPPLAIAPATEAEWLGFAREVRAAACPVVAFVPYRAQRWPRLLARAMAIIEWDRTTTAGRAAHARRSRVRRSLRGR